MYLAPELVIFENAFKVFSDINLELLLINSFFFLPDIITCRNMTLDLELRSEHTFECSPISSCNVDMDINTVTWRKSYDEITYQTLSDGNYVPLNETNLMNDTDNIELENHDNIWIFRLTDTSILSVGYYQAVDENNRVLYSFVIYCK